MTELYTDILTSGISCEGYYLRGVLGAFVRVEPLHALPAEDQWQKLDQLVQTQAVVAICRSMIPADKIPDEIRFAWDRICTENFLDNSMALSGVRQILPILEQSGIPAAVLRGIRMAYEIYPDPIMRPMRDVDILIPPDSSARVCYLLALEGMKPEKTLRSQLVYSINGKDFEIHWSYVTPRRYSGVAGYHKWLEDMVTVSTPQGNVSSLKLENELLGMIVHAFVHHDLNRISQAVDIALVMRRDELDWDYIIQWAMEARLSKMIAFVFAYIEWLFTLPPGNWSSWSLNFLPPDCEGVFCSYAIQSLGQDDRRYYLMRKKHLLYVAESFPLKAKQLLRFLTWQEVNIFVNTVFLGNTGKQKKGRS
jgi:hypothetical protein